MRDAFHRILRGGPADYTESMEMARADGTPVQTVIVLPRWVPNGENVDFYEETYKMRIDDNILPEKDELKTIVFDHASSKFVRSMKHWNFSDLAKVGESEVPQ